MIRQLTAMLVLTAFATFADGPVSSVSVAIPSGAETVGACHCNVSVPQIEIGKTFEESDAIKFNSFPPVGFLLFLR